MKLLKNFLVILVLSAAIATGVFFINSHVIKSVWQDDVLEITFITIPIFIVLSLLYFVNRALFKTVKRIKKKKPSGGEGFKN